MEHAERPLTGPHPTVGRPRRPLYECRFMGRSLPVVERVMPIRGNGRGAMEVPCTWIPTPGD